MEERKGWKDMLEGYFREFTKDDNVVLVLRTYLHLNGIQENSFDRKAIMTTIDEYFQELSYKYAYWTQKNYEIETFGMPIDKEEDHEFKKMEGPVYITQERNKGRFNRLIRLPLGLKNETSAACFENGVLHLKFDKEKKSGTQVQVKIK